MADRGLTHPTDHSKKMVPQPRQKRLALSHQPPEIYPVEYTKDTGNHYDRCPYLINTEIRIRRQNMKKLIVVTALIIIAATLGGKTLAPHSAQTSESKRTTRAFTRAPFYRWTGFLAKTKREKHLSCSGNQDGI